MKKLIYFIVAGSLILASCNKTQESNSQESAEHGHSHDESSEHSHDTTAKEAPLKQEEFVVNDSTQSVVDTTTLQKEEGTHTHEDGKKHKDHK